MRASHQPRAARAIDPGPDAIACRVAIVEPGPRHAGIVFGLIEGRGGRGNLTTDAHLAALAIEKHAGVVLSAGPCSMPSVPSVPI
jgi:hypothetical protein